MPALRSFVGALQSLAFTLRRRTLALVRKQLPVVRRLFAVIGNAVPLIGDAIPFISDPLAPRQLTRTPRENVLALIAAGSAAIETTSCVGTLLGDHNSP